jgi:hypothetical protein
VLRDPGQVRPKDLLRIRLAGGELAAVVKAPPRPPRVAP